MTVRTKLHLHNNTWKAASRYGSEVWILNKTYARKLEVAHIWFLRQLLGLTTLHEQRNNSIPEKVQVCNIGKDILPTKRKRKDMWQEWKMIISHYQLSGIMRANTVILARLKQRWKDQEHLQDQEEQVLLGPNCSSSSRLTTACKSRMSVQKDVRKVQERRALNVITS